jgi:hypothetical protein
MLGDIKRRRAKLGWLLGYAWFLGEAIRNQVAILPFNPIFSLPPNIPTKILVQIRGLAL